jgi:hypothetical protein
MSAFGGVSGRQPNTWECLLLTLSGHERGRIGAVQTDP